MKAHLGIMSIWEVAGISPLEEGSRKGDGGQGGGLVGGAREGGGEGALDWYLSFCAFMTLNRGQGRERLVRPGKSQLCFGFFLEYQFSQPQLHFVVLCFSGYLPPLR